MSTQAEIIQQQQPAGAELAPAETLETAFGAFLRLNVAEGDASPETIRSYHTHANEFVAWCEGAGVDPAAATEADVLRYRSHLVEAGYARGTIGVKLSVVRRIYKAATWRGMRDDNPAAGIKAPSDKTDAADRRKFLPLAGFRKLLDTPDPNTQIGARDRAILALLGLHGLRVAEVAGLAIGDLHLGDPTWVNVAGKGSKRRQVYLTPQTKEILETWLAAREARAGVRHVVVALDNRTHGTPMTARGVRYAVDGHLETCGLKEDGISCHSLRHSFATWSLAGGAKLESISAALGHSSVETTQVYAKIVDKMTENPTLYLEKLMDEGGGQ